MKVVRLLSLDAATRYTGYAYFGNSKLAPAIITLNQYGILKAKPDQSVQERCYRLCQWIGHMLSQWSITNLVVEFPSFQAGRRGMQAAHSGDTLSLARLCGGIERTWEFHAASTHIRTKGDIALSWPLLVTFPQWNGQVSKEITCLRLKNRMDIEANYATIENNYADAIMMGLWWMDKHEVRIAKDSGSAGRVDMNCAQGPRLTNPSSS